jgi:hypothetical protein
MAERLIMQEEKPTKQRVPSFLWLTFPIWGAIVLVVLGCNMVQLPGYGTEKLLTLIGGIGLMLSASPIFTSQSKSALEKIILILGYYIAGAIAIYIFGWLAACWFCSTCH